MSNFTRPERERVGGGEAQGEDSDIAVNVSTQQVSVSFSVSLSLLHERKKLSLGQPILGQRPPYDLACPLIKVKFDR